MSSVQEILSQLRALDIILWVEDNQLHYDAPTGVLTPTLRKKIVECKQEIIQFLSITAKTNEILTSIVSVEGEDRKFPLSPNQEQLWFFDQLNPRSSVYNVPGALRIRGPLNIRALEFSLNEIIRRHSVLRTIFPSVKGKPIQKVLGPKLLQLPLEDRRDIPKNEQESNLLHLLKVESQRPFDLSGGPLWRPILWILNDNEYILQLTIHHIITDGWSVCILIRDLTTIYEACVTEKSFQLPEIKIKYTDFSYWQEQIIEKGLLVEEVAYWQKELSHAPNVMNLPFDRAKAAIQTHRGGMQFFSPHKDICEGLSAFSRHENTTLFVTLMTAFQVLLYRYTEQSDSVIGFLSSNRRPETEDLIGFFVNTLPLRIDFSGNPGFRKILFRTRDAFLRALKNGNIPFGKIVELLKSDRDLSHNPIFQVLVVLESVPSETLACLDLKLDYFLVDYEKSKFDLTLFIKERGGTFQLLIEYSSDLFDALTINRMLQHFDILLKGIVKNPDLSIRNLPILTDQETQMLLEEWNCTSAEYPMKKSLHNLFEEKAEQIPDIIAVVGPSRNEKNMQITYRELNIWANQLAHYLQKLGAKTESLVGVLMERSLEMVVGLLAIIKSGAAYVPLDPEYPQERISFIVKDAKLAIMLTSFKSPKYSGCVIFLPKEWDFIVQTWNTNPVSEVTPESAAYVIYTSGSTGKPKGVVNVHRGICNRLLWMQDTYMLAESDRVLQKTSFSFDVSIWEFFWPLISGTKLVMARPGGHRDNAYLVSIITIQKITTIHFVPSMLRLFLEEERVEQCNKYLKRVICSGEEFPRELQGRFFDRLNAALYNLYGPTEAAIDVTWWECQGNDGARAIPIGKPIANTQIYLLDSYLQPVPVGVPGELHIGGHNLALGYLNRPELTKEKFIPHPFSSDANAWLFKTCDQARYLPDGNIEFLGRLDYQVKIRGYRIEPGEIEVAIKQHLTVDEVVVVAKEDTPGIHILVAYIVSHPLPSISELREFLKTKFPDYMVPTSFVLLEAIPLTPNGKVNRAALPIPGKERPRLKTGFIGPQTPNQRVLADIWASVLKLDQVGIHDKFFDLGGDSIRIIQVLYMAKEKGLSFSLQDMFRNQTIAQLSVVLKTDSVNLTHIQSKSPLALLREEDRLKLPRGLEDAYPLSMLQTGLVFHSGQSPEYAVYVTTYHLRARFEAQLLQIALDELADRHPMLRTSFDLARYSEPLQLVHQTVPDPIQIKIEDWRYLSAIQQSETLTELITVERNRKFNWESAPLFRFYTHLRTDETFQFTIVEPILDGWSVMLLATELFSNYQALLRGKKLSKAPLLSSYRDYVALEQAALLAQEFQEFWTCKLESNTKTMLSRWPSELKKSRFIRKQVSIPQHVDKGLKELAHSLSVPLKSVLLAAHLRVIGLLSGQTRVLTGLMANGRPETREGEQVIGLFLNVVPLNFKLVSGTWLDLIKETFKAEVELLPFRRYPLARIQLDHGGPLFDTIFNFIHFYPYKDIHGTEIEILDIKANDQTYFSLTAQFSLDWRTYSVRLSIDFNANDICDEQIESIAGYYARALIQMTESPQKQYLSQSLLSETEQNLFSKWNCTSKNFPEAKCFHQLFEEQVEQSPDAVAIIDDVTQLTYHDLNTKANQLARYLVERGVGLDFVVAIIAHRSADFLINILGIFKAGGAYLPLHPDWPSYRIHQILKQSNSKLIISTNELKSLLEDSIKNWDIENRPLVIGLDKFIYEDRCEKNLSIQYSSKSLAYVIYTSGSTGIPKGVMIEHCGMINHLYAKIEVLQLGKDCILAQTASQSFDISVWQFIASLLVGGRVVVAGEDIIKDPCSLVQLIEKKVINIFETVPSFLRTLLEEIHYGRLSTSAMFSLKWLLVTGEAFPSDLCKQWLNIYPQISLVNAYGPTECSDDVTHFIVTSPKLKSLTYVPIGRPLRNTKIYILDQGLRPLPIGVPGELFVEGIGVCRGYLNNADQTSTSFIANPFKPRYSDRIYRTGDLARFLPDGVIEFMGRMDHQVKIRGFRIEPGEIESVLRQHQAIKNAFVMMRKVTGKEEIVAYVVFESGLYVNSHEIHDFLSQHLPHYMFPSFFVYLDTLPVNQNGKVDRQALPDPEPDRPDLEVDFASPRTPLEEVLLTFWQEVLGIKKIGIYDNFFDLGGHSLQAIQLVSKMSMAINFDISVRFLLLHPSVAAIAEALGKITLNTGDKVLKYDSGTTMQVKADEATEQSFFSFLKFESRSLLKLFNLGKIEPVDAAALGYLPISLMEVTQLSQEELVQGWFDNLPEIRRIFSTSIGRVCHITLPMLSSELYHNPEGLLDVIVDGLEMAGQLGARVVSLTGLLPSATDYGRAVSARILGRSDLPSITTGHAITTVAIVFSIEKILAESGRNLSLERVGILGTGSIGLASLRLMLTVLPHPLEISLYDVYSKHGLLKEFRQEIIHKYGFKGEVKIFASQAEVPIHIYRSTLIVGATNVPDVLDLSDLKPGTIILDDSAPHCFNPELAIERLEKRGDILFTEGGILKSPQPISELRYFPNYRNNKNPFAAMVNYRHSDYEIMGCIFSSLFSAIFDNMKPTIGFVDNDTCVRHYEKIKQLGYESASLSCRDYLLPKKIIQRFRQRFGNKI